MKYEPVVDKYISYLTDEAGFIQGSAERIYFPTNISEIQEILKEAYDSNIRVTISGGGTGVSGGRVPLGGWIIATDKLVSVKGGSPWKDEESGIEYSVKLSRSDTTELTVPAAMTVKAIQNYARQYNLYYPPDPTERSCFIAGNVASNASGSRSFKYGVTRDWIQALSIVTPMGEPIKLIRTGNKIGDKIIIKTETKTYNIPFPDYYQPKTRKNVAGPNIDENSELIDLFIGSGGMFGVIAEITIRLIDKPADIINMFVYCNTIDIALELVSRCRYQRDNNIQPIPLSVEYVDDRAVRIIHEKDNSVPNAKALVIIEQEFKDEMDNFLEFYLSVFDELGIEDTSVAQTYKEIEYHKFLRHLIPETINALVKSYGQSKLGTDYAVPPEHYKTIVELGIQAGNKFENEFGFDNIGYAMWSHAGDAHIHLNFLPRNDVEMHRAKELMVELLREVVKLDGTIAAEHGLGKKTFLGKPALFYQIGERGLEKIREMKLVMDPKNLLNAGNLFPVQLD